MATTVYVTLKNRTSKTLTGRYDGKQHDFPPGYSGTWPEYIALVFRNQNPVMGSEDYFSGSKQYLLAIPDIGDDDSPIEQTNAVELWDRSTVMLPPGTQLAVIKGQGYNPVRDKGRPAPSIQGVRTESFEPLPGDSSTETISLAEQDRVNDYKP